VLIFWHNNQFCGGGTMGRSIFNSHSYQIKLKEFDLRAALVARKIFKNWIAS